MLDRVVRIPFLSTAEDCSRIALQIGPCTAQQPQSLAAHHSTCPVIRGSGLEPTDRTGWARTYQIKAHRTGNDACSRTGGQNVASLLIRKLILGRPCQQPGEPGDGMTQDCLVRKCCCVQVWYSCCKTKIQIIHAGQSGARETCKAWGSPGHSKTTPPPKGQPGTWAACCCCSCCRSSHSRCSCFRRAFMWA